MPQIDIKLTSAANVGGFDRTLAASQGLDRGLRQLDGAMRRVERGFDTFFRGFTVENVVRSFLGGAGIGSAFAVVDKIVEKSTESSRKLKESIDAVKKAETELAAVRDRIARANRSPSENLAEDRLTLQGVETSIAEYEGIQSRNAYQNNELARLKRRQADLIAEIAKNEEAVSREIERQIEASNRLTNQANTERDEAAKKRVAAAYERLVKIGEDQMEAEFARLAPAEQINRLLDENARLYAESLRLNLDDVAQLERAAEIEARRLQISKQLETAYKGAAAEVDQMTAKQLAVSAQARAAIDSDPALSDMQKRRQILPILEEENRLISARITALEKELALVTDPAVKKALEDRVERMGGLLAANIRERRGAQPRSLLAAARDGVSADEMGDPSKHYQTLGDGAAGGALSWMARLGTMADQLAAGIENTLGAAVSGITNGIMGWINGAMTFGQMLSNIGQTILQTMLQTLVQMGVQWLVNQALIKTGLISIEATGDALRTARVVKENAAEAATLPAKTAGAAASGMSSFGMTLAFGLMAVALIASLAGGFAEGGVVRGPGTGTSDSILARLSNGESVLTARTTSILGEDFVNALNANPTFVDALMTGGVHAIARPYQPPLADGGRGGAGGGSSGPQRNLTVAVLDPRQDRSIIEQMERDPRAETWFVKMQAKHRMRIPGVKV